MSEDEYCSRCDSEDCRCLTPLHAGATLHALGDQVEQVFSDKGPELKVELAKIEQDDRRVVPPPTAPMRVAAVIANELFTGGDHLHLRSHRGEFYRWDGTCWIEAEGRGIRGQVYRLLEGALCLPKGKTSPEPWDPTRFKVDNVVDALKTAIIYLDGATEPPAWINPQSGTNQREASEIVAMNNGLLHVPTRELLPHSPDFFVHHALPYDFDADAPPPDRWLQFLKELWGDDASSIGALQEIFGYVVAGGTEQQKIFLLVGPKRGGKGTIGRVLTGLLGRHNVAAPTLAGMATNFGVSPLIDRPLALISDARLGTKADASIVVERLLSISGEDSLTIDRKYREPWTGRLPTRFLILTNELPRLSDSSGALSSRFVMLVLTQHFYGRENPKLTAEILDEAPGILNWALDGLDRLNDRGHFRLPASSREALRQLEDLASPMAAFLRERCTIEASATVAVDDLWVAWKLWCEDANQRLGTKATFGRDLRAASPLVHRARARDGEALLYVYEGIGLSDHYTAEFLGTPGTNEPDRPDVPSVPRNRAMYHPLGSSGHHDHPDAP